VFALTRTSFSIGCYSHIDTDFRKLMTEPIAKLTIPFNTVRKQLELAIKRLQPMESVKYLVVFYCLFNHVCLEITQWNFVLC